MVANSTVKTAKRGSFDYNMPKNYAALNPAAADKKIKEIKSSGKRLKGMVHETAVGILMHYEKSGDWTKFTALMGAIRVALGTSMVAGFQKWVIAYSPLSWDKNAENDLQDDKLKKGNFVHDKELIRKEKRVFNVADAKLIPFWEMEPDQRPEQPFDLQKAIQNLLKTAKDKAAKGLLQNDSGFDELVDFAHEHGLYKSDEELEEEKRREQEAKSIIAARIKEELKSATAATREAVLRKYKADKAETTHANLEAEQFLRDQLANNEMEAAGKAGNAEVARKELAKEGAAKGTGQAISTGENREEPKADKPIKRRAGKRKEAASEA